MNHKPKARTKKLNFKKTSSLYQPSSAGRISVARASGPTEAGRSSSGIVLRIDARAVQSKAHQQRKEGGDDTKCHAVSGHARNNDNGKIKKHVIDPGPEFLVIKPIQNE
jgi:hypothetical protein